MSGTAYLFQNQRIFINFMDEIWLAWKYKGAKNLVFVSSRSLKTRELSFTQFVYFLRKV